MANVTAKTSTDSFDGLTSTTAGNDVITANNGTANMGDVWNGGDGVDRLLLNAKFVNIDLSQAAISGVEELLGGKRNDRVSVSLQQFDSFSTIDLGKGADTLTLGVSGVADAGNAAFATLVKVESLRLSGSTGADSLNISGSQLSGFASIAMQQGADVLNLTSTSANFNALGAADASITGLETVSAAAATSSLAARAPTSSLVALAPIRSTTAVQSPRSPSTLAPEPPRAAMRRATPTAASRT